MFTYSSATLTHLSVHRIEGEGQAIFSDSLLEIQSAEVSELLSSYLLSSFRDPSWYQFSHESDRSFNEVFTYCQRIFDNPGELNEQAVSIIKHLQRSSRHPSIKPGELFVGYFTQLNVDDQVTEAIVIAKSETKKEFLEVGRQRNKFHVNLLKGLDAAKVDKAAVVFNLSANDGYRVWVIDNVSKGNEAQYWKDDFLGLRELADSYSFTKNYLTIAKSFITKQLSEDDQYGKAEQADLLTRSIDYFKENESFNAKSFEEKVFADPSLIQSFREFGSGYLEEHNIDIADQFEISDAALKRQIKQFKSVIKLDKNFHIYIHGGRNMIEQGIDPENGRKYYKIYFDVES